MYRYTVRCRFDGADETVIQRWLDWLTEKHIADVVAAGATGAELVRMSTEVPTYEIRYGFESRDSFVQYLQQAAPGLREEGLIRFPPPELGLIYDRSDGQVLFQLGS